MSFLRTKTTTPQSKQPTAASGVTLQSSVYGRVIAVIYGTTRQAGNLLLYGNFSYSPIYSSPQASGGGSGKGGLFGGNSGAGQQPQVTGYNYSAAMAFALCEGPIVGIVKAWQDKNIVSLATLNMTLFTGTYPQTAWGTTVTWSYKDVSGVTQTGTSTPIGYNGIAYVATPTYALGGNTSMPNITYEVEGIYSTSVSGKSDADPSLILPDVLTNTHYGIGFPSARIATLSNWQDYSLAAGLLLSPNYDTQRTAADVLDELAQATNSEIIFASGQLSVVPRGDQALSGNGKTYTPPSQPEYALTDDDFQLQSQGTGGASAGAASGPVLMTRKRPSDKINSVKIEFLDRANNYQPGIAYANDQALIDLYGLRTNGSKQMHLFCDATAANLIAHLQLRREQISNTYQFDLDQRYILLDPMDIVSITDSAMGLAAQWVRITEIQENENGSLSITAEEYLSGVGGAPAYTFGSGAGTQVNANSSPGAINTPVFFEPPYAVSQRMAVYCAVSGPATWGGADVYVSTDGVNYKLVGRIIGSARAGTLTSILPTFTETTAGATIDQTSTLAVDLTLSAGTLTSASNQQALNLASLCWVDSELISYATATLTAANKYSLTYLIRGAYGTTISAHAIGTNFIRMDEGVLSIPYASDRVGQTISVKFLSFNQYGGGQETLAAATPYTYMITGAALSSDLEDVSNLTAVFVGNLAEVRWTEITDFRPILYEIRVGSSWDSGQFVCRQAHPPFRAQGDGTYWIAAYSQPAPNLVVYSATPQGISIVGSNITANVFASHQEDPGWAGALSGSVSLIGATIQTTGVGGGTYTIPAGDRITITYPFACAVIMKWTATASPLNNSIFQFQGTPTITSGSANVSNLKIFTGTGRLYGNQVIDNVLTTAGMGAGQWVQGTGIPPSAAILAVLSTTSFSINQNSSAGSTAAPSTQTITVFPYMTVGNLVESTSTAIIPAGASIATLYSTDLSLMTMSTTALATSTVTTVRISIDWLNTPDFLGAAAAQFADIYPQIRLSTDGGGTWGAWQNWQAGYYFGNSFDARMQVTSDDINSIGILETWTFKVDVPDRIDHFVSYAVSSLGSTLLFRPDDGGTTAAFNGGNNSTLPTVIAAMTTGGVGPTVNVSNISLSGCRLNCYSSTGGAIAGTVNVMADGY